MTLADRFQHTAEVLDHAAIVSGGETASSKLDDKSNSEKIEILKKYKDKFIKYMFSNLSAEGPGVFTQEFFENMYDIEIIGKLKKRTLENDKEKVVYEIKELMTPENFKDKKIQDQLIASISRIPVAERGSIIEAVIDKVINKPDVDKEFKTDTISDLCALSKGEGGKYFFDSKAATVLVDTLINKAITGINQASEQASKIVLELLKEGFKPSVENKKNTFQFIKQLVLNEENEQDVRVVFCQILFESLDVDSIETSMTDIVKHLISESTHLSESQLAKLMLLVCCAPLPGETAFDTVMVELLDSILSSPEIMKMNHKRVNSIKNEIYSLNEINLT